MPHPSQRKPDKEDCKDRSLARSWTFRGIDCPSCALGIEERLSKEAGVDTVRLDYARKTIRLTAKE